LSKETEPQVTIGAEGASAPNAVAGAKRTKADMLRSDRAATKPRMRCRPLRFMAPSDCWSLWFADR
jgi:hypothetical protein